MSKTVKNKTVQGSKPKKTNFALILIVYLLGIFMGAIDTGIITPARTVIQAALGVDANTGIWMITIYTLSYAASIPIMGKLADKYGRKYIYLTSIFLFGTGSLFCGVSQHVGSFSMLLLFRVVQAIGGGGILPIATAEFGTTFPKEKRGLALGLVGGVYGIANIIGSSAGSAILDLFGTNHWDYIFFINIPITLFILIAGFLTLPNTKTKDTKKIDYFGITTLTIMVLCLLYGLKNIDYFNFISTFTSTSVFPFLLLFVVFLPLFIMAEKKAEDPVMNLGYFKNLRIVVTLIIAFITGIVIMGMVFVPQFSENALKISTGSGGYFVIILGLFAGVSAPVSGRLIDHYGAKLILLIGFVTSILGSMFLIFIATSYPNMFTVCVSLMLMGLGIGFTMGTPLNYMMLDNTKESEANSALATVSLVRSIGTAIAPAIMIGFLSHAGMSVQSDMMALLPTSVKMPSLPYAKEITETMDTLKSNKATASMFKGINIPDLTSMETIPIKMEGSASSSIPLPNDLLEKLRNADVTTITADSKLMADYMFTAMTPSIISNITTGLDQGITGMQTALSYIDKMGGSNTDSDSTEAMGGASSMTSMKEMLTTTITQMKTLEDALPSAFATAKQTYLNEISAMSTQLEQVFQDTLNTGFKEVYLTVIIASGMPRIALSLLPQISFDH